MFACLCAPYSFVRSSNSSDALCTIKNREDALLSIVPSWTFCPSVTLCHHRRHGERRPSPDRSVSSQAVDNRLASELPPPTCLLSRINGVTRCVRAPVPSPCLWPGAPPGGRIVYTSPFSLLIFTSAIIAPLHPPSKTIC